MTQEARRAGCCARTRVEKQTSHRRTPSSQGSHAPVSPVSEQETGEVKRMASSWTARNREDLDAEILRMTATIREEVWWCIPRPRSERLPAGLLAIETCRRRRDSAPETPRLENELCPFDRGSQALSRAEAQSERMRRGRAASVVETYVTHSRRGGGWGRGPPMMGQVGAKLAATAKCREHGLASRTGTHLQMKTITRSNASSSGASRRPRSSGERPK